MTATHYETETDAAEAFDNCVKRTGLFTIYPEVRGTLLQPRPGQVDRSVRIDRVLIPTQALLRMGWRHGIIGAELKRSGTKVGPAIAQAMDYTRCAWTLPDNRYQVVLGMVFLWPVEKQHDAVASILAQNRLGTADSNRWALLHLASGELNILHVSHGGDVRVGAASAGTKVGSR